MAPLFRRAISVDIQRASSGPRLRARSDVLDGPYLHPAHMTTQTKLD
jgi:hypothetical protein